ncbi:MAG: Dna2/Cas4 domain-containing protein, partial [Planctomycetaceae bacterium]|nr:Dna2/Cas4 domain-containing protein [Planctomycetaceae bacterium]
MSDSSPFAEDDLLPLRYLNDLLFCERRLALHLVEQIWKDNQYTAEGEYAHRKVDQTANLKRGNKRNVTGMMLVSYRLGVTGKADLVEFRSGDVVPSAPAGSADVPSAHVQTSAVETSATQKNTADETSSDQTSALRAFCQPVPYPVDFKRGKKRRWDNDEVQLCAQAMCLEEMLHVTVPAGAIFHIKSQHRREVLFAETLRQQTIQTSARLHEIVRTGITPHAEWKPR